MIANPLPNLIYQMPQQERNKSLIYIIVIKLVGLLTQSHP